MKFLSKIDAKGMPKCIRKAMSNEGRKMVADQVGRISPARLGLRAGIYAQLRALVALPGPSVHRQA